MIQLQTMLSFFRRKNSESTNGHHQNGLPNSLSASHLQKTYSRRRVVDDVSLSVNSGEVVGLLGANGAGKTTTFYMMTGLERAEKGKIFLNGQNVTNLPMYLRARLGLGYLPQEPSIFRKLSAEQNILAVLETMKMKSERTFCAFRRIVGRVWHHACPAHPRRCAFGRRTPASRNCPLFSDRTKFILLDEPFAGIDPIAIDDIREIIFISKIKISEF